jgi:3-hydroxyisobutyrate dehydrogenase-like beta-hydroxyacid dehydrogenase
VRRVAVLGIMGGPTAGNRLRAGHEVTARNRTAHAAELLEGDGACVASTPVDAVRAPVFEAISRGHVWLGEAGLGTRLNLVVNTWILCTIENLAETFVLPERLGVHPRRFLEAISGGGMDMPNAHLKGDAIINRDFTPSFPLRARTQGRRVILEAAGELELPLVRATLAQFDRAFELGQGDEDMSAVYYASAAELGDNP